MVGVMVIDGVVVTGWVEAVVVADEAGGIELVEEGLVVVTTADEVVVTEQPAAVSVAVTSSNTRVVKSPDFFIGPL
jgi:hypothetical protein